ncbi:J domain-containing protein [Actinocorallia sp. A-T 12471]|uniref:J domain-containing protein n=1 Tax=Actinocorallia sp. A-T 12471 TaxID=3089813 RepID=UPI0029CE5D30|nr:J domain-containing protein [Actinocorallia sp. A-T 12471]MDX6738994.1 J domain-containing protein [Actinocorallia sp. A-T 12471]
MPDAFGELEGNDAYAVLGLSPDATDKEILTAHRRLVFEHHPDRNGDSPAARAHTTLLNAARHVLTADRAAYDRWRAAPPAEPDEPAEPPESADDPWSEASFGAGPPPPPPNDRPSADPWDAPLNDDPDDDWDYYEQDSYDRDTYDRADDLWEEAVPSAWSERPPPAYPPPYVPPPRYQRQHIPPTYDRGAPPRPYPPPPPRQRRSGLGCIATLVGIIVVTLVFGVRGQSEVTRVPLAFGGTWQGEIRDTGDAKAKPWKITVKLVAGTTEGTTSYPGHGCKGVLTFEEADDDFLVMTERATGECADSRIRFTTRRDDLVIDYCGVDCDRPTWTGTLTLK